MVREPPSQHWVVRRAHNMAIGPYVLIDTESAPGDDILAWNISERFAPVLARCCGARLQH